MTAKKRAVVVFPGRGSYAASELGYLNRFHKHQLSFLARIDGVVRELGGTPPSELDAAGAFSPPVHLPGRNASNLIYACALADFSAIDRDRYDIVAVCGNSLGWYLTLAAAGALSLEDGAHLVDTMGHAMEVGGVGGQLLYPLVDDDWRRSDARHQAVEAALAAANAVGKAFPSIDLGGIAVLAGDAKGIAALTAELPRIDDKYPMRLPKHAAFHTPLLKDISDRAQHLLPPALFQRPQTPAIDGRGVIWSPDATDTHSLHAYTLGHQITERYDFTASIRVALRAFAPDCVILTGPGASLGPPVAQTMIAMNWDDIASKEEFTNRQRKSPFVIAMGRDDQRRLATG